MGLNGSIRLIIRKARPVVYRLPVLGKGLRYLKRAIVLPWNFHKHYQAAGEHRGQVHATLHDQLRALHALNTQQAVLRDSLQAHTGDLAAHLANALRDALPPLVAEHIRQALADPVRRLVADFRVGLAEMAGELRSLNDRHATCYDRLAEQLRRQTEQLRALAEAQAAGGAGEVARQLADLAAAQDDLSRQLAEVRADGADAPGRLRLTA
jgi:hypothetical protein